MDIDPPGVETLLRDLGFKIVVPGFSIHEVCTRTGCDAKEARKWIKMFLRSKVDNAIDKLEVLSPNTHIGKINISNRACNCLESARIETLGQLVEKTDHNLLKIRSFGKWSLRNVKEQLALHGLSLKSDSE